jgi:hypothetical protein
MAEGSILTMAVLTAEVGKKEKLTDMEFVQVQIRR